MQWLVWHSECRHSAKGFTGGDKVLHMEGHEEECACRVCEYIEWLSVASVILWHQ